MITKILRNRTRPRIVFACKFLAQILLLLCAYSFPLSILAGIYNLEIEMPEFTVMSVLSGIVGVFISVKAAIMKRNAANLCCQLVFAILSLLGAATVIPLLDITHAECTKYVIRHRYNECKRDASLRQVISKEIAKHSDEIWNAVTWGVTLPNYWQQKNNEELGEFCKILRPSSISALKNCSEIDNIQVAETHRESDLYIQFTWGGGHFGLYRLCIGNSDFEYRCRSAVLEKWDDGVYYYR